MTFILTVRYTSTYFFFTVSTHAHAHAHAHTHTHTHTHKHTHTHTHTRLTHTHTSHTHIVRLLNLPFVCSLRVRIRMSLIKKVVQVSLIFVQQPKKKTTQINTITNIQLTFTSPTQRFAML